MDDIDSSLESACVCGFLDAFVEEYVSYCQRVSEESECVESEKRTAKKTKNKSRFPNVAGFCRYFNIGNREYEALASKYPCEFDKLYAILEDEAFNSDVSPTLLSAYLKKRLGYEKKEGSEIIDGQLKVIFDHDIMEDGE